MGQVTPMSETQSRLLAQYLRDTLARSPKTTSRIPRRRAETVAPLTVAQEELWLRELRVPRIPPLYNECITLRMRGPLRAAALEAAFNEVVRRHEIWRTTFEEQQGRPVQVVHPAAPIHLPVIDLRSLPRENREAEAIRQITKDTRRPFDLANGPLLRPTLVTMEDSEHTLFLVVHQIVIDGMSAYQIFPSELAALYKTFSNGEPPALRELPIQYADFACWQRELLTDSVLAKQLAFWRREFADEPPPLNWPVRQPLPEDRTFRGALQPFTLSDSVSNALKKLTRREGATLFTTLLAALATLLHIYTGQEDIVLGTLAPAGRKRSEVHGSLGYFLNPVALRINFRDDPDFRELLRRGRSAVSGALSNDDIPAGVVARELSLKPNSSRGPFPTAAISLQPPAPVLDLPWSVTSMDVESGGSSWDLYIAFIDGHQGLIGRVQYNPDLFKRQAIAAVIRDLESLMGRATLCPELPVSAFGQAYAQSGDGGKKGRALR